MVDKLGVCRICLSENIGSGWNVINNDLQEFYQKLTLLDFKTEDRRPMVMCYICLARLRKAYTFKLDCLAAEQLFSLLLDQENKVHIANEIILHRDKAKAKLSTKVLEQVVIASTNDDISPHPVEIEVHIKHETSAENDPLLDADDTSDCIIPTEFELDTLKVEIETENGNSMENMSNDIEAKVKTENKELLLKTENLSEELTAPPVKISRIIQRKTTAKKPIKIDSKELIAETSLNENFDVLYKCKICNRLCNSHDEIVKHKQYHNKARNNVENTTSKPNTFDCHLCSKSFKYRSGLRKHIQKHTGEKPFKCTICHKSFADNSYVIKHIRVQHPEGNSFNFDEAYKCDICQKGFKRKCELKEHSITHGTKPYQCDTCQKYYKNRNLLARHIRIAHTDEKQYQCDKCHLAFKHSQQLKIHYWEHTGENPYKCNICHKSFSYKAVLANHSRTHTGERPFKCDQCWKSFKQQTQLSAHILIHTGLKPYKCETCSRCFIQPSALRKHVRTHTGEKPYKCSICPTAFAQQYPWVLHMRSHTGEKPYECEVCQKKFRSRARLKKHSVVHTGEKPFNCDICHRDFGTKSTLRRHRRNVHKVVTKQSSASKSVE